MQSIKILVKQCLEGALVVSLVVVDAKCTDDKYIDV